MTIGLVAQELPYCVIKSHPFDIQKAREEISQICKEGYIPVGMEVEDGAVILVMYVKSEEALFSNWALVAFGDFEKNEKENADLTEFMKAGWLPIAFSYTQSGQYMLFLKTDVPIAGVRFANGPENLESIENIIKSFGEQGFYPYGMSWFNNRVWYFFLKIPTANVQGIVVKRYKNFDEGLGKDLEEMVKKGYSPWDIMVSPEWVYIVLGK